MKKGRWFVPLQGCNSTNISIKPAVTTDELLDSRQLLDAILLQIRLIRHAFFRPTHSTAGRCERLPGFRQGSPFRFRGTQWIAFPASQVEIAGRDGWIVCRGDRWIVGRGTEPL